MFFTGPPGALANKSAHLFTPTAVLKLKSLFQISSDEKVLLSAQKASANHLASFFLISVSSGHATYATFPSLSNQLGHGVLAAFDLHSDCLSGQSSGLVSSNTEG